MVRLGDVCEVKAGATHHGIESANGKYPVYGSGGYICQATECRCPAGTVTVGRKGTLDKPLLIEEPFWNIDTCFGVIPGETIDSKFLWLFCLNFDFYNLVPSLGRPSTNSEAIKNIQIPLPPIEVQKEIVAKLDAAKERSEKLKAAAERGLRTAENLRKAILSEAFEL
jgi:type I restriction enzyme S subunit